MKIEYDAKGNLVKTETVKDSAGNERTLGKNDRMVFTNVYEDPEPYTVSVDLGVSKSVEGSPKESETFTFRLEAVSAPKGVKTIPMPSGSKNGLKTVEIKGKGNAHFGSMVFDTPGTYVYKVSEKAGANREYTYDTKVYTVTVEVAKKADGTLSVEITALDNNKRSVKWDELVFVNTYKPQNKQTGVLWWPVPVLLASGLVLTFVGVVRRKHEN